LKERKNFVTQCDDLVVALPFAGGSQSDRRRLAQFGGIKVCVGGIADDEA